MWWLTAGVRGYLEAADVLIVLMTKSVDDHEHEESGF